MIKISYVCEKCGSEHSYPFDFQLDEEIREPKNPILNRDKYSAEIEQICEKCLTMNKILVTRSLYIATGYEYTSYSEHGVTVTGMEEKRWVKLNAFKKC